MKIIVAVAVFATATTILFIPPTMYTSGKSFAAHAENITS